MKVDFIGDIHGHAVELENLLLNLGYNNNKNYYSHPDERKVVFVGDFIDRGLQIRETLQIVKGMCDNGTAKAVMGNHEYNAILFHTKNHKNGGYYRDHSFKEINHHIETLRQFKDYPEEWKIYLDWFKNLPLFLETENYRVVHAYWNQNHIEFLKNNPIEWNEEWFEKVTSKNNNEYEVIEDILKGKEFKLPVGYYFLDADKAKREDCRVKWWQQIDKKTTFGDYLFDCPDSLKQIALKFEHTPEEIPNDKPIFFGHYWLKEDEPVVSNSNAICLDYSVAKNGHLVAYSLDTKSLTIQKSI
jgi:hypothetical protein